MAITRSGIIEMNLASTKEGLGVSGRWARLRSQTRPIRFLASRFLWHSRFCSLFAIPCGSFRLRFYPTAHSATLWLNPAYRLQDEEAICGLLREGDSVIDVGANIGAVTLAASRKVGDHGKVYSIEAHPRTYKYLCGNLRLNDAGNVTAFNVACGAADGMASFSDKRSDDQNAVTTDGLRVPVKRLDKIVPPDARIALLKIDVEGYEKFVLMGASGLLPRVDSIYLESDERHFNNFGYGLRDISKLLRTYGFTIYHLNGQPVAGDYSSMKCENLLAKRN